MKLAESFGWEGSRVEDSRELRGVLERSFETDGPTLISLPIDYGENPKLTERLGNIACPI